MTPIAFMRRWAFDKVDVMKLPVALRPKGWRFYETTAHKLVADDVPLVNGQLADELVRALQPFAALLHENDVHTHREALPDAQPVFAVNRAAITLGDLRRARAALRAAEGGTP